MPALLIVDVDISDTTAYDCYKSDVQPIIARHGGEYLARGGSLEVLESDLWSPTRIVVIRFPDMAAVHAFNGDPAYQPIKAVRHASARSTLMAVDGI